MAKEKSSKNVLIIVGVILGVMLLGGLGIGFTCYHLYKIGSETEKNANTTTTSSKSTANWPYYNNARYNFSVNYPKTFTAQESVNGDGTTLTSASPAITISVSGALNSQNITLDQYLNVVRATLFNSAQGAQEIAANETTLSGLPAQERKWQYINPIDNTTVIMDEVTAVKGDTFYIVGMIINSSDYTEFAPTFKQVLESFKIN